MSHDPGKRVYYLFSCAPVLFCHVHDNDSVEHCNISTEECVTMESVTGTESSLVFKEAFVCVALFDGDG